jgi:dipeptidyl aminopeptidase/acylaminoacyl peptidase
VKKTTQTKIHRLAAASVVAVSIATCAAGLSAQETRSSTLLTTEHWLDWERVSDAQISPDGARIVYTRQHVNALEDKWESEVWILNADGAQHRFFVKGSAARWSPDGKRLMYLAEGEPKWAQIFVRPVAALGTGEQALAFPQILPEGKAILFSAATVPDLDKLTLEVLTLANRHRKIVARGGNSPRYLATSSGSGHLVYVNKATLFAIPFDLDALETRGTAVTVLDDVAYAVGYGVGQFDVSRTGTLVAS